MKRMRCVRVFVTNTSNVLLCLCYSTLVIDDNREKKEQVMKLLRFFFQPFECQWRERKCLMKTPRWLLKMTTSVKKEKEESLQYWTMFAINKCYQFRNNSLGITIMFDSRCACVFVLLHKCEYVYMDCFSRLLTKLSNNGCHKRRRRFKNKSRNRKRERKKYENLIGNKRNANHFVSF